MAIAWPKQRRLIGTEVQRVDGPDKATGRAKYSYDMNPKATPAQIEEALAGNICRCGTYEQMRHAIAALCTGGQKKEG